MVPEINKKPLERVIKSFEKLNETEQQIVASFTDGMATMKGLVNGCKVDKSK